MNKLRRLVAMAIAVAVLVPIAGCASSNPATPADDGGSSAGEGGTTVGRDGGADATAMAPDAGKGTDSGLPETGGGCGVTVAPEAGTADAGVLALGGGPAPGAVAQAVTLDSSHGTGRVFDGLGAISGGGGNSRLLYDYPEPYRSFVLDYLFKPSFGANLQILKVEIGGDANSTDGSEPSHMHSANDLACNRGWELWLMQQAKARNPNIKLYGLSWGAPGWITGGTTASPFSSPETVLYLLKWLDCAKQNGLAIDYIGGQNERAYDKAWFENLHASLAAGGYAVKVVGADGDWGVADDMVSDSAFANAIDVVGAHYPCGGDGSSALTCASTANAQGLGKPLWASENGSQDYNSGAPAIARAILRGYLDGQMTSFINWPLVGAIPPALPFETTGLLLADDPWSGAFGLGKSVWVFAHVTQFVSPGAKFVDAASGYVGGDRTKGSYVTLQSGGTDDYVTVVETTTASAPETLSLNVGTGFSSGEVHVWATSLVPGDTATSFEHVVDVSPVAGAYWLTLAPQFLYTLTTTSGQTKGNVASPPRAGAALPYADGFEGRDVGTPPRYLCDQDGAFEVAACGAGRTGRCLRQAAPATPIEWAGHFGTPYTIVGTNEWRDYTVSADVLLEEPGSVEVLGRFGGRGYYDTGHNAGYYLSVTDTGSWAILRNDEAAQTTTTLASGTVAALGTMTWHTLALSLRGSALSASIDGAVVGTATDGTYTFGPAGLAVGVSSGTWLLAQYDNLSISPLSPVATPYASAILNRAAGTYLDVVGASTVAGTSATLSARSGAASQEWQLLGDGSGMLQLVNLNSNDALAAPAGGGPPTQEVIAPTPDQGWQLVPTGDGAYRIVNGSGLALGLAPSSGGGASSVSVTAQDCATDQEWILANALVPNVPYVVTNRATQMALDVVGVSTQEGAGIDLWPATGAANQTWIFASGTPGVANAPANPFILTSQNSGMVLDVPAASAAAGVALDQWPANGGQNQVWSFAPASDGYFTVTGGDGLVLDTQDGGTAQGALVVQAASNGMASQEWSVAPAQ